MMSGMSLPVLFYGLAEDMPNVDVTGLQTDSSQVKPGDLFLASSGERHHGMDFWQQAIEKGAAAIVYESAGKGVPASAVPDETPVPVVALDGLDQCLGQLVARFYGNPSHSLKLAAVTGTNGKTSVSWFIASALEAMGECSYLSGTLGYGKPGELNEGRNTTPGFVQLNAWLAEARKEACQYAVMEASSHAIAQGRIEGLKVNAAIFTNLSQDHLDYHGDLASYGQVKASLADAEGVEWVICNADDEWASHIAAKKRQQGINVYTFGTDEKADFRGRDIHMDAAGLHFCLEHEGRIWKVRTRLLGEFNVSNLLASIALLMAWGFEVDDVLGPVANLETARGRMQVLEPMGHGGLVVVDYAHTPDALEKALLALKQHCEGSLFCVFGCGGERDRGKRQKMGSIAEQFADKVILTADNPRSESLASINADILEGFRQPGQVHVIEDRKEAIARALAMSDRGDVVLIAGKGHENYQISNGVLQPFNDAQVAADIIRGAA